MIAVIDNYDSFTYNLVQYIGTMYSDVRVFRNDTISVDELAALTPEGILISPGPGIPEDAGISIEVVKRLSPQYPILGVCLGHQAIGVAFGAKVVQAPQLMHGKTSEIHHDGKSIYSTMANPFTATRYHSLIIDEYSIPARELEITSRTQDGTVMGIRHRHHRCEGVQFHPESVLTQDGMKLVGNFVHLCRDFRA